MAEGKASQSLKEKLLYLFTMLFVIMLTGVVVLSILLATRPALKSNLCTTPTCIKSANAILTSIDETVDPCEDFYKFSCGNFIKQNRIEDSQSKVNQFSKLNDDLSYTISDILLEPVNDEDIPATINAKKLFVSCLNEEVLEKRGIQPLLTYINERLNGWPILNGTEAATPSNSSVLDRLIRLKKVDSSQLFELFVSTDPKNPKRNVLRVLQPSWVFNREYLDNKKVMAAYKTLMTTVVQYFVPDANISTTIDSMLSIENRFTNLQINTEIRRNSTYRNFTLAKLAKEVPEFEWREFIVNGVFKDLDNIKITEDEVILVDDFDYIKSACKLYADLVKNPEDKKNLENLLIWILVKDVIGYLPKKFQIASLEFDKVFLGTSVSPTRRMLCSNMVNSKMEDAVGRLYVSKYFDKTAKKDAKDMVENILSEFKSILKESDWMDEVSKQKAIEKATLIDIKIGYSERIYNNTKLNEQYKVNFSSTEFLENHYTSIELGVMNSFKELRKEIDPKQWISGAAVVNAFYSPPSNQICFPAGILQQPFYDANNPKYLNYGGIGMVIGHEITHGFDDVGRLYDKNGVFFSDEDGESLWSNKTIQNYKAKVQCIIDQYNSYEVKQVNKTINGINTQGENIADNGGLKESFRAYKRWASEQKEPELLLPGLASYTQEQLFFMSYGMQWCGKYRDQALVNAIVSDSHSPGEFRVVGSTSNFQEFSDTFKCRPNQRNNPANKCSVW